MALYPYPDATAMALNNVASLAGSDDDQPKKPALYRAGRAVGSGLNAAHQVAAAGDMAADRAINAGVDAMKLGVTNFVRGVQGKPALNALPTVASNDPVPPASPAAQPSVAKPILYNPTLDQMRANGAVPAQPRAGQILVAPVRRPASETGVTLPDGRKLPYGAMVNGVPTFSDGTGGFAGHPSSIPRTMTDAEIRGLGDRLNIVPASTFTRGVPAFNSDDSEANIAAIMRSNQGGKFGTTPEMSAAADLAAVANQDPRTTLGRAALNASRRANAAPTTLQRKAALTDLAGLNTAVQRNAAALIDNAAAQGRANTEAGATLKRQSLANTGALQQQALQNEGELARTDLAGRYGLATTLASPKKTGEMTPRDYMTQLNTGVQAQIKNYNDQQALLPADQRQPLTDAAITEMRAIQAKALGLRVGTAANGQRVVEINGQVVPL